MDFLAIVTWNPALESQNCSTFWNFGSSSKTRICSGMALIVIVLSVQDPLPMVCGSRPRFAKVEMGVASGLLPCTIMIREGLPQLAVSRLKSSSPSSCRPTRNDANGQIRSKNVLVRSQIRTLKAKIHCLRCDRDCCGLAIEPSGPQMTFFVGLTAWGENLTYD